MADTMTSKERVMVAFAHEEPDRVPAWCGTSPEFRRLLIAHLGLPDEEASHVYLGDDFRRVFTTYVGPDERSPDKELTPGTHYRTPFNVERTGLEYGQPTAHPLRDASLQAIHDYPWPDPAWMDASRIRQDAAQWGGQYAVLGGDWSPFWHDAIDLMEMEPLLYRMYDEPEAVDALFGHLVDYYFDVSVRIFEAAADVIDIFFIGNDFGGQTGPLIGDAIFRRFFVPHLKRLADLGHDYGLKVMMHCCGSFVPLLPAMIEAGLDGVQALQPKTRNMDPATLKAEFGDKILLNGCIDSQSVLIEGTPELARAKTREVLDIMKPGGGYVASPSHDYLLAETPIENVLAMYEAIREYGAY